MKYSPLKARELIILITILIVIALLPNSETSKDIKTSDINQSKYKGN